MYCTPCSFRLFASKSAPLISAMSSPVRWAYAVCPVGETDRRSDYAVIAGPAKGLVRRSACFSGVRTGNITGNIGVDVDEKPRRKGCRRAPQTPEAAGIVPH